MRSTQPITVHERMAICKSRLEGIIENPGNTGGGGGGGGGAGGLAGTSFWSLVRRLTIPWFSSSATINLHKEYFVLRGPWFLMHCQNSLFLVLILLGPQQDKPKRIQT